MPTLSWTQSGISWTQSGISRTRAGISWTQSGISRTQSGISWTRAGEKAGAISEKGADLSRRKHTSVKLLMQLATARSDLSNALPASSFSSFRYPPARPLAEMACLADIVECHRLETGKGRGTISGKLVFARSASAALIYVYYKRPGTLL
ncbi:hypothetical protein ACEVG1_12985 [Parapedobacter sp. 2B3]